jgi:hypothetical protein
MKRYTVRLRAASGLQEIAPLRAALEKHLLSLPITFRLGAAEAGETGEAILEMASDDGIEVLRSKLGRIAGATGSVLLSVQWGWQLSSAADGGPKTNPDDPLPASEAAAGQQEVFGYDARNGLVRALGSLLIVPAIL